MPVVEKADVLSLEVLSVELRKLSVRTAGGPVEVDCLAQVKIKGDEAAILAAAEHFLSRNEEELKNIVRPVLEEHVRSILGGLSHEELGQDLEACAARVEAAASPDLGNMGLAIVSFTIQSVGKGIDKGC